MKTLREEVAEVVTVMRRQLLDEIADELRARFSAKHALDVEADNPWALKKLELSDGTVVEYHPLPGISEPIFDTELDIPAPSAKVLRRLDCEARQKLKPKHIKTAWVKIALKRLLPHDQAVCSYRQVLGQCRRGRRSVSAKHLSPILHRLVKSGILYASNHTRGMYLLGSKAF